MTPWIGTLQLVDDGSLSGGIVDSLGWQIQIVGTPTTDSMGVTRWRITGDVVVPDSDKLPWEIE